jgi:hypothetical protein
MRLNHVMRQLWVREWVRLASAFTAVFLFTAGLLAAEVELLEISDPEHPRVLQILFQSVTLVSLKNDNSSYRLTFEENHHAPDDIPPMRLMLKVGEEKLPFTSGVKGGSSLEGVAETYSVVISNAALVPLIARELHATVQSREDPHYKMRVEFEPEKPEFAADEPIIVIMRITNLDDREFAVRNTGLRQRRASSFFSFAWARDTGPAEAPFKRPSQMSIGMSNISVKPAQSREIRADLSEWFRFEPNSTNILKGRYNMQFFGERTPRRGGAPNSPFWTEAVSGEFTIKIKP